MPEPERGCLTGACCAADAEGEDGVEGADVGADAGGGINGVFGADSTLLYRQVSPGDETECGRKVGLVGVWTVVRRTVRNDSIRQFVGAENVTMLLGLIPSPARVGIRRTILHSLSSSECCDLIVDVRSGGGDRGSQNANAKNKPNISVGSGRIHNIYAVQSRRYYQHVQSAKNAMILNLFVFRNRYVT